MKQIVERLRAIVQTACREAFGALDPRRRLEQGDELSKRSWRHIAADKKLTADGIASIASSSSQSSRGQKSASPRSDVARAIAAPGRRRRLRTPRSAWKTSTTSNCATKRTSARSRERTRQISRHSKSSARNSVDARPALARRSRSRRRGAARAPQTLGRNPGADHRCDGGQGLGEPQRRPVVARPRRRHLDRLAGALAAKKNREGDAILCGCPSVAPPRPPWRERDRGEGGRLCQAPRARAIASDDASPIVQQATPTLRLLGVVRVSRPGPPSPPTSPVQGGRGEEVM